MPVEIQLRVQIQKNLQKHLPEKTLQQLTKKLLNALGCEHAELSLLITDDQEIAELNEQYRGKAKPTDVLSFPQEEANFPRVIARRPSTTTDSAPLLGDVVISLDTAISQAQQENITVAEEITRLIIHGTLHLIGYEHENVPEEEAALMQAKEAELLEMFL